MNKQFLVLNSQIFRYLTIACVALLVGSCSVNQEKPTSDSEQYQQAVSDFYLSLAAMQSDQAIFAVQKMQEVLDQYPEEPAVWSNLAVYAVRLGNFELATERIQKAVSLAPDNSDIHFLAGVLESRQGNAERALDYLKEAFRLDSTNLQIQYALADELERQDDQSNRKRITALYESMLDKEPTNTAILLELVRIASKWQDEELLNQALESLGQNSEHWSETAKNNYRDLDQKVASEQSNNLTFELAYLRNSLNELKTFQEDLRQVQLPQNQIGFLINKFLWLPQTSTQVKPVDTEITFTKKNVSENTGYQLAIPVSLFNGETDRWLGVREGAVFLNNKKIGDFPSKAQSADLTPANIAMIDFNYDFRNDLAFAGPDGLQLFETQHDTTFVNITDQLGLSPSVTGRAYQGIWAQDIDSDGDLDIVLSPTSDEMMVLQNNGDGTFTVSDTFSDVKSSVRFLWADLDADGDSDAVFLTEEGSVHILKNERAGSFKADGQFESQSDIIDLQVADVDGNGQFELVSWNSSGVWKQYLAEGNWKTDQLLATESGSASITPGEGSVYLADLDNNGALDVITSGSGESRYWFSDDSLQFIPEAGSLEGQIGGFADLNNDNRLDAISLAEGQVVSMLNHSSNGYNARIIRPEASGPLGDRRINSFGIGGELEVRSGLLYQRYLIEKPWVHVGLGNHEEAEMLRIIWPNGSTQAEFAELGYDSNIVNEQMLKGSCPWIFTNNGEEMEFVTDFLWRTALGLRINAQGEASVIHSIDWIKIEGNQLKPKNGYYDVRITADLWETHFFDQVSLMVVDHPEDTEVMVDERFTLPAPEQRLYSVSSLRPVSKVLDQDGKDVTSLIREKDGEYIDTFDLTAYQGLANEYYMEVHLDDNLPENKPVYLVAHGWLYPTDSSINVAISQGDTPAPRGLFLQVQDKNGKWKTVKDDIGFPAGKSKNVLINLSDLPLDKVPEKIRLTTNMEIYWDQVTWAVGRPDVELKTTELEADVAELRYRGFSEITRKSRRAPDLPNYKTITGTAPKWIDLVGHYTRFGDVRELVQDVDDRYVIMNAGDELVFKFPVLPEPKEGWVRDYVLVGDGWVKDGDLNTGFSKTVLPLPYHGMKDYSEAPGRLEDDPVYQKYSEDWVNYHTRYITPYNFNTALKLKDQ